MFRKSLLIFFTFFITLFSAAAGAFGASDDYRLDFDPADLKLIRIENVNGEPFSAAIRNFATGREFEYFKGDYIGPLEVYKIETMQVELRHKLSRQRYMLALPIDKIDRYAEKSFKDQAELDYDQAALYYKAGDASRAVELLQKAVAGRNGYEDALFFMAYIYHENNYFREAYEYYSQVMVVNPRNYKCLYNMAEILAANSRINDAVATLKKCLKLRPDYQKAISLLDKINDELEARDKKDKLSKENASMRVREVEMLKKTVAQYAENIKQLETALAEAKKSKADIKPIEAELSRYRLLYNNSASSLEEKLKK